MNKTCELINSWVNRNESVVSSVSKYNERSLKASSSTPLNRSSVAHNYLRKLIIEDKIYQLINLCNNY